MVRGCWRIVLLATTLLVGALGNLNDTSTGIDLDKLPRFALSPVRSGLLKGGSRVSFDGITATAAEVEPDVEVRGVGKSGKPWVVHMCCVDEVWRADLDGNGNQDYIFIGVGPYGNGRLGPAFSLSILLMDSQGLPVPFFANVFQGEPRDGIKQFVDLEHDGHAELLLSTYDEGQSDPLVGTFCSGHWVTQLYRFKDTRLEEFRGTMGGIHFPFVHNWTYGVNKCPSGGPAQELQPPILYEHGTPTQGEATTKLRDLSDSDWFAIVPVSDCTSINPSTVVYDRKPIREIAFPTIFSDHHWNLAKAIFHDHAPVKLSGIDDWMGHGDCSANLMWAER